MDFNTAQSNKRSKANLVTVLARLVDVNPLDIKCSCPSFASGSVELDQQRGSSSEGLVILLLYITAHGGGDLSVAIRVARGP
jgi:hypothetical protein